MQDSPHVTAVLNPKGGTGKTTTSTNLASEYAVRGERVLLIDTDPQGSALDWDAARALPPRITVTAYPRDTLHQRIKDLAAGYDRVIIDGAARNTTLCKSAVAACDRVLIVLQPSPYDVWGCDELIKMVQEGQIYKPELDCRFLVNRVIPGTVIGRDFYKSLEPYPYQKLTSTITQRVGLVESAALGMALSEYEPTNPGVDEIVALVDELTAIDAGVKA